MRSETRFNVLVVGDSFRRIVPVSNALLTSREFSLTISEVRGLGRLPSLVGNDTDAVVLLLTDEESSVELRELISRFPETAFVLVAPRKPARAALARLAEALGAGLVTADDAAVVVSATLTSLLAQRCTTADSRNPTQNPESARGGRVR